MNRFPNQECSQKSDISFREAGSSVDTFLQLTRKQLIDLVGKNDDLVYSRKSRVIGSHQIILNYSSFDDFFIITFPNYSNQENGTIPEHVLVKDPLIANEAFRYACNMANVINDFKQLHSVVYNYVKISNQLKNNSEFL
ncbi:MAG: hypothetical protein V3575_05590 [Candidatus Absconditabacteria bacterium]